MPASKKDSQSKIKQDKKISKDDKHKKNTSLRLDAKTLKELKVKAINDDLSVQKIMEKLIKGYLKGEFKID
ncbi:CopG family transcriptional regulator [Ketobacter nezhaii]|uniref:CopG family transcriptional regulator n=1 Tax=Ketobacter sp. MCCC 1A13808 TaxID=2602738 RepID=UPI0012EC15AD|nr:CopG family transcriptional regulator [Ketobacter sp. MCCC 1A13808]